MRIIRLLKHRIHAYFFFKGIKKLIKQRYITPTGEPIKCTKCKSTRLASYGHIYENGCVVEFYVKCKDCDSHQGTWAYGGWTI